MDVERDNTDVVNTAWRYSVDSVLSYHASLQPLPDTFRATIELAADEEWRERFNAGLPDGYRLDDSHPYSIKGPKQEGVPYSFRGPEPQGLDGEKRR